MNENKFHTGRVMRSTPREIGRGSKANRKHVLLRSLAQLKHHQIEQMKKTGEIREEIPNEIEHWLYVYSDHTIARLNHELLKLQNQGISPM